MYVCIRCRHVWAELVMSKTQSSIQLHTFLSKFSTVQNQMLPHTHFHILSVSHTKTFTFQAASFKMKSLQVGSSTKWKISFGLNPDAGAIIMDEPASYQETSFSSTNPVL